MSGHDSAVSVCMTSLCNAFDGLLTKVFLLSLSQVLEGRKTAWNHFRNDIGALEEFVFFMKAGN